MDGNVNWNYPTAMRVGRGRASELPAVCREFGVNAPLLVTDPGLSELPMTATVIAQCTAAGLGIKVFSDIKANPTGDNVRDGVAAYQAGGHDGVIAFGGGSGLDVGKTVGVMAAQDCALWELEDVGDNWRRADAARIAPIIAVPTTAGTGSEVGRASVIVHQTERRKVVIFHPQMLPACVILDPELTVALPANLTAATGMDALSHNLEAYCAPAFHPMAEGIAVAGMRLIADNLPVAVADGRDLQARTAMLVASAMGATAFQRGLGAMHALAHPLGARYDAHHGMLNAILMPYVLRANRAAVGDAFDAHIAQLARCLGMTARFDAFLDWVLALRREIGIPNTLAEIGIDCDGDERAVIGEMAVVDPSAGTNVVLFGAGEYAGILGTAIDGDG